MCSADTAFELLSDPLHLPAYVPTLRLEDSTAVDGADDPDADVAERQGAPEIGYTADRATRTIRWGDPDGDDTYGGTIAIETGTTLTAKVTMRVHVRAAADPTDAQERFDRAMGDIRKLLSGR